jgi:hypothetical protein
VRPLRSSVAAGESGPVVTLSGEADLSTAAELSEALARLVSSGSQHLTVDITRLTFRRLSVRQDPGAGGRAMKNQGGV